MDSTLLRFAQIVADMRAKQDNYFRTKQGLRACKEAEQTVDRLAATIKRGKMPGLLLCEEIQKPLFFEENENDVTGIDDQ